MMVRQIFKIKRKYFYLLDFCLCQLALTSSRLKKINPRGISEEDKRCMVVAFCKARIKLGDPLVNFGHPPRPIAGAPNPSCAQKSRLTEGAHHKTSTQSTV